MGNIVETVPFDFDELYAGLKAQFEAAGYDTEEGSNTSQLITAMAYFTSMLNVNTAVNINEPLLPLATKRNNVVQDARALGYEIQHKQSYSYYITLKLTAGYSYNIPKYSVFTVGNFKYYYFGNPLTFTNITSDTEIELRVVEGNLYKSSDYPETLSVTSGTVVDEVGNTVPQYFIDIPFIDVEEDGLEVFVTYYDELGQLVNKEQWTKSEQFMIDNDADLSKKYIRLDNISFRTPRLYFKLSGVGEGLRIGSVVDINVLTSNGSLGKIEDITALSAVQHVLKDTTSVINVEVVKISLIAEGAEEESITSIKENAPKFYNSANRAVTKTDYESICNRETVVSDTVVWGGEDEYPKSPGHIWFSYKPSRYSPTYTSTDSFNSIYNLNYGIYTTWDYTIVAEPDWSTQYSTAETYYSGLFLENQEIRSNESNDAGQIVNPGVWDSLDGYKIPTIEFHNRHPIFIDFEYSIEILKYQIVDSKATFNNDVFNIIKGHFLGSTTDEYKLGNYSTEYFHSSLEKRIDNYLSDNSGYNNSVTSKILLTKKNVAVENTLNSYRDIYIPLSVPFEPYFDANGNLITSALPNINTTNFIDYSPVGSPGTDTGQNLSVAWDEVFPVSPTKSDKVISAPVRITQTMPTLVLSAAQNSIDLSVSSADIDSNGNKIELYPDFPSELNGAGPYTYTKTSITLNGVPLTIVSGAPGAGQVRIDNQNNITLGDTISGGETLNISIQRHAGTYYLFNGTKKHIIIHLYIDAGGYSEGSPTADTFDSPKSYLTTIDGIYLYSIDNKYLTTEGYAILSADQLDSYTGSIVKQISTFDYSGSPIKMDLFRRDHYLNLSYLSPNFKLEKNALPRLKKVTFV